MAGLAQLVEQRFCKPQVVGSNPITSSMNFSGEVPERSKGSDCKSDGIAFDGSNPSLTTTFMFEHLSHINLSHAHVAQW